MSSKTLIILPYIDKYSDDFVLDLCNESDYIICADGGQDLAYRLNIKPDVCIGDFDSTSIVDHLDCEYIRYPAEKDITDGEACLEHALGQGFKEISFLGGIGGRLDHTLGALALLEEAADYDVSVELKDENNRVTLLKPGEVNCVMKKDYKYLSIVPLDSDVSGLCLRGVKYPLENAVISRSSTLCISNEILNDKAIVECENGYAYIIQSNDK